MGILGDLTGGIAGLFSDDGSDDAAQFYKNLVDQYGKLNPNINAQQTFADSPTRSAQLSALSELENQYRQGGLDPIAKSQVAQANTSTDRNAQALSNSIVGQARAQGNAGSGVTRSLQMQAGQDQAQRASEQGMEAAAGAQQRQHDALTGAGQLATAAGAQQNAIDRYNSMANLQSQQATFGNKMGQLEGQQSAYGGAYGAKKAGYADTVGSWGSIGGGVDGAISGPLANYLKPKG